MKTENIIVQNDEVAHQFNQHDKFNDVLQKLAITTAGVIAAAHNTLDYDNVILENEKADVAKT